MALYEKAIIYYMGDKSIKCCRRLNGTYSHDLEGGGILDTGVSFNVTKLFTIECDSGVQK